MEALIGGLRANGKTCNAVVNAYPEIVSHNLETVVRRLTKQVRIQTK
jgi:lipoate synthase